MRGIGMISLVTVTVTMIAQTALIGRLNARKRSSIELSCLLGSALVRDTDNLRNGHGVITYAIRLAGNIRRLPLPNKSWLDRTLASQRFRFFDHDFLSVELQSKTGIINRRQELLHYLSLGYTVKTSFRSQTPHRVVGYSPPNT